MTVGHLILIALFIPQNVLAFQGKTPFIPRKSHVVLRGTVGGWGIGPSKEMKDEEFSNVSKRRTRKRRDLSSSEDAAVYGRIEMDKSYELEDSVSFAEKVKKEKQDLRQAQMNDLMKVAKIAGIGKMKQNKVNVEDDVTDVFEQKNRLGKFDPDLRVQDDNLDVRVSWDE